MKYKLLGGVIQQTPQQGFGWFGNQQGNPYQNQFGNPAFPKLPPLFLPNFAPPVYYPNTLPFPNFNPFPAPPPSHNQGNGAHAHNNHGTENGHGSTNPESGGIFPINNVPGSQVPANVPPQHQHFGVFPGNSNGFQNNNNNQHSNQGPQGHNNNGGNFDQGQHTHHNTHHHEQDQNTQHSHHNNHHNEQDQNTQHTHHTNRIDSNGNQFATNAFFKPTNIDRRWTQEDEQEWQATTKAPYFENKVPGLSCVLPASAVLGVKNYFCLKFI